MVSTMVSSSILCNRQRWWIWQTWLWQRTLKLLLLSPWYTASLPSLSKTPKLALSCYHRFNQNYQPPTPSTLSANMTTLNSPNSTHNIWFPCTEATNHFTADINNLNVDSLSYHSSDQVSIEDGSSLPILHTGSANLHSLQGTFLLSNLLHAPLIAKNLLLVK